MREMNFNLYPVVLQNVQTLNQSLIKTKQFVTFAVLKHV